MKKFVLPLFALFAVPALVFAAGASGTLTSVLGTVQTILNALIPILITLAVVYFFWGLAQYILQAGSSDAKDEGRQKMIWGIIALFVMVSIWGILGLLANTFDIKAGGSGDDLIPKIQVSYIENNPFS